MAREVIATLPRELNVVIAGLNAPSAPFVPEQHHFQHGYALMVTGFGSVEEHDRILTRIRDALPPLFEFVTPMPYVALLYEKGTYVEDLSDAAVEVITEQFPRKSSPSSLLLLYRFDEAYSEVGEDDTAFSGGRSPRFAVFIVGVCPTEELWITDRAWVRSFWDALRPHATGVGSYINAMAEFEDHRVRTAYDPGNVFHRNANIKPA